MPRNVDNCVRGEEREREGRRERERGGEREKGESEYVHVGK